MRERYAKLDKWLAEFHRLATLADAEAAKERDTLRAAVLDEFRQWRAGGAAERSRLKDVAKEHKHLVERAKPGTLSAAHKRI